MVDKSTAVPGQRRVKIAKAKPFYCDCGKRFATTDACDQHRRDSPPHASKSTKTFPRHVSKSAKVSSAPASQRTPASVAPTKSVAASPSVIPSPSSETTTAAGPKIKGDKSTKTTSFRCCGRLFEDRIDLDQHREDLWRHIKRLSAYVSSRNRSSANILSLMRASAGVLSTKRADTYQWAGSEDTWYQDQELTSGMDWGACYNDCGWCGNCMNNAVIYEG